ncbi:MAG: hypothetical protein IPN17_29735 [Deltaproteobacteria bacterium]|nr:hypothetical protein [Deltaproteobacteria bacterium]
MTPWSKILRDPKDPSFQFTSMDAWREDFARRLEEARRQPSRPKRSEEEALRDMTDPTAPAVGRVTEQGMRLFRSKREAEARKAVQLGVAQERPDMAPLTEPPTGRTVR